MAEAKLANITIT